MVLFIVISSCFSRYGGSGELEYIVFTCFVCYNSELIIFTCRVGGSLVGEGLLISGGWGLIFVQVVKWGSAKLCPNVGHIFLVCYFLNIFALNSIRMPKICLFLIFFSLALNLWCIITAFCQLRTKFLRCILFLTILIVVENDLLILLI